jgi:hypothetical protein
VVDLALASGSRTFFAEQVLAEVSLLGLQVEIPGLLNLRLVAERVS